MSFLRESGTRDAGRLPLLRQHMKDYIEFAHSGAARGVRILAEYHQALEQFERLTNRPLVTVFGSARLGEQTEASRLAEEAARLSVRAGYGVVTGGSAGIMLAANKGAFTEAQTHGLEVKECSVGCTITLPFEETKNKYLGTETDFHYFFIRKYFLVAYSKGFFFFEGGGGTRDELWEVFTLIQTGKMPPHPIVAVGPEDAWKSIRADLGLMVERGTISPGDRAIVRFMESPRDAVNYLERFWERIEKIYYNKSDQRIEFTMRDELTDDEMGVVEERFAKVMHGLRWDRSARIFSISQFKLPSYAQLYEVVEVLNSLGRKELPAAGQAWGRLKR